MYKRYNASGIRFYTLCFMPHCHYFNPENIYLFDLVYIVSGVKDMHPKITLYGPSIHIYIQYTVYTLYIADR